MGGRIGFASVWFCAARAEPVWKDGLFLTGLSAALVRRQDSCLARRAVPMRQDREDGQGAQFSRSMYTCTYTYACNYTWEYTSIYTDAYTYTSTSIALMSYVGYLKSYVLCRVWLQSRCSTEWLLKVVKPEVEIVIYTLKGPAQQLIV